MSLSKSIRRSAQSLRIINYEQGTILTLSYEYMKKTRFDNRASVRRGHLGLASRTLVTIRDEVTVDSQRDARLERGLGKGYEYMIDIFGCPPHNSSRCG